VPQIELDAAAFSQSHRFRAARGAPFCYRAKMLLDYGRLNTLRVVVLRAVDSPVDWERLQPTTVSLGEAI